MGTCIAGFPNAFMMFGPNIGTASCMPQLEAQLNIVVNTLRMGRAEIRPEVVDEFKAEMNRRLATSTWQAGGCKSFYMDATGDNYLVYAGTMREMIARSNAVSEDMFV